MGYKTDTNQLADSMAHFVSSQWSIIGHVLFSTRNRNIRISCPFSCYYLMWQHRILIHSQSGLIIGGYWVLWHWATWNPIKIRSFENWNPRAPRVRANVTMWQKHDRLIIYLHVSPRSPHVHLTFRRIMERQPATSASTLPIQKLPSAIAESFISILNTVAYYSYLCRKFIIYIYVLDNLDI